MLGLRASAAGGKKEVCRESPRLMYVGTKEQKLGWNMENAKVDILRRELE